MIRFALLVLLLSATTAHAQTASPSPPRLSDHGRYLIAGELGGWWEEHDWRIHIAPSVSYFVADRIGVGGYFRYTNERNYTRSRDYELGLLGSYEIPLADRLGLWVLLSAGYLRRDEDFPPYDIPALLPPEQDAVAPGFYSAFTPTRNWLRFGLFVPFVYQINEHVGLGLGPDLRFDWAPSAEHTDVRVGVASWIPISI